LHLVAGDFGPGPVITLNLAARRVRELGLPNRLYLMQKDGCVLHLSRVPVPLGCVCPAPERMVEPRLPEHVILSAAESPLCFLDYPNRHVVDVQREFRLPWNTMSLPVAVRIAHVMGCTRLRMLAMDAYTIRDGRRVDGTTLVPVSGRGYALAGKQADLAARRLRMRVEWVRPLRPH
jgi:hypothetical protein